MADPTPTGHEAWDKIAHQAIQGPLAKIIATLETVAGDAKAQLAPALKSNVQSSLVTARRLMDMFESLLVVQRLNAAGATLDGERVSVGSALEPAIRSLDARAKAAEVAFGWTANEIGLAVAGDEDLLRRAFRLAAERVLDDVPKGGSLRAAAATGGGAVRIRITGSALTDEDTAFSVTEPVEIGFARLAVERMGGKVTCVRARESGSMIDLILPVPTAKPVAAVSPSASAAAAVTQPAVSPAAAPAPVAAAPPPPAAAPPPPAEMKITRESVSASSPAAAPPPAPAPSSSAAPASPSAATPAPLPEPAAEPHEPGGAPHLSGMVITAPWTGSSKKPDASGTAPHHAAPETAEEEAEREPKAGGLKITRHVNFDLMSKDD